METGMIVISAVLFAIIAIPTLLIIMNAKKQTRTLFNGLNTLVRAKGGIMSQHIEQNNFALGIDGINKKLFFFKKMEDREVSKIIDLTTGTSCEVVKKSRCIKDKKRSHEVIELIALSFSNAFINEEIELYNENDSLQVKGELAIAEEWKKIINNTISHKEIIAANVQMQPLSVALS